VQGEDGAAHQPGRGQQEGGGSQEAEAVGAVKREQAAEPQLIPDRDGQEKGGGGESKGRPAEGGAAEDPPQAARKQQGRRDADDVTDERPLEKGEAEGPSVLARGQTVEGDEEKRGGGCHAGGGENGPFHTGAQRGNRSPHSRRR
jgi:hypothetical protein